MRPVFFLHNPKAGGTALRASLAARFAAAEIAPCVDFAPEVYGPLEAQRLPAGYALYMGHYGWRDFRAVARDHLPITNFRHPAARILSLYNYFRLAVPDTAESRTRPEYFAVRLARAVDFAAFVASEDPRVLTYTRNHHFRQLANTGWSLQEPDRLEEVCEFIERMAWYYVCEYPALSVRWGRVALQDPSFTVDAANVTPRGPDLGADALGVPERTFNRILALNRLDLAIYVHALGRLFREQGDLAAGDPASPRLGTAAAARRAARATASSAEPAAIRPAADRHDAPSALT